MELKLKYKGIFDIKNLYDKLSKYFRTNHFIFFETVYKDKGDEVEIKAEFLQKTTDYLKISGEFNIHVFDSKDVDVNGKIMQTGRFEFSIKGEVTKDYDKKFKSEKGKKLKPFYEKLKKDDIGAVEDILGKLLGGAYALIKKELEMDV